jgi:hypothetical protein
MSATAGKKPTHLSWDNFCSSIFIPGEQRVHRVSLAPLIEIFGDGIHKRIGLWLEVPLGTKVPDAIQKLAFIHAQTRKKKSLSLLELCATSPALHRHFYHFAVAVSERVLVEKRTPTEAALLELQSFAELLQEKPLLGIERQLGLLGELIVLERLLAKNGPKGLDSWIGPQREPHDFRLEEFEFEVKTTICSQRIHTIHGTEQLVPSKGCSLFLLSVLLGPAGQAKGFSLLEKAQKVATLVASDAQRREQLRLALETCGFRESDGRHYTRRFVLRRPLAIAPVNKHFPAIDRPAIQAALGSLAPRVEDLQYDVNIEGLEKEDGTSAFAKVFPA